MKTTTLTLALVTLPLALGACVEQSSPADDDLAGDPNLEAEAAETVRVTVLDHDESGEQTEKVSLLTRAEVQQLEAQRSGGPAGSSAAPQKAGSAAPQKAGSAAPQKPDENVGTAEQALSVKSNTSTCFAKGLLIYSGYSRSGDILCLITAGHEAGGTAGFFLPADWRLENGGRHPKSYWSGDDSGRFAAYFTDLSFGPWTIVDSAPSTVVESVYVYMHRTLNAPAADPSIAPPAGYPLVHKMAAKGHQIYVCKDLGAGSFAWTLSAPSALLIDTHSPGDVLGWHYAGPQWRSADDGSSIKAAKVAEVASPDPSAIPWLKLEVTEHAGAGLFSPVAFVQRVNTVGGKQPATACSQFTLNQTVWVDYTADYYFYAAPTAPAGWACSVGYYNANDGCDCQCGMPDPDCAKLDQIQYGCFGGQVCNQSGQCVVP